MTSRASVRRAVDFLVLTVLLVPPPAVARQDATSPAGGSLRVMSYNIKHGQTNAVCTQPARAAGQEPATDCNLDIDAAISVIRAHDPDIAAIQEVDRFWARSAYMDEPAVLSQRLGYPHSCYGANLDHPPDAHAKVPHQYGTLILSRLPILECSTAPLPRAGDGEQRGLTRASIDVRGVRVQFYNTHLHTAAADRLLQTAEIAKTIDAAPEGVQILAGDFNARPTAEEMAPIFARFTDAWQKAGVPAAGNSAGYTSPAHLTEPAASRIDYVLVRGNANVTSVRVPIDAQTRHAADHYPVVVNLSIPARPPLPQ